MPGIPMLPKDSELLLEWLKQIKGTEVKMIVPERGFKRKLKDMAMANAKKYLSDKKLQWEYQDAREQGAVKKLKELLNLPRLPESGGRNDRLNGCFRAWTSRKKRVSQIQTGNHAGTCR